MRRGLLLSFLLHGLLVLFFVFNVPNMILPEPEVTYMNVKLVSSPDAARSPKPKPVKPVKTQQSSAPREVPKPKKKKVEAPKHKTKMVDSNKSSMKKAVKEEPKDPPKQEETIVQEEPISRPPLLDKTPDKKNLMAEQGKPTSDVKDEDFLQALDFIEDMKDKKSALEVSDDETATVFDETQGDVAKIKSIIEKNWYRTPGVAGLDRMKVVIMIKVNRDGTISSMNVVESSGRASFDNSILRAVRKSVPLPIPEGKYDIFRTIQISFNR